MKRYPLIRFFLCVGMVTLLNGCGAYARNSDTSGVQVYGTVDTGVSHESR